MVMLRVYLGRDPVFIWCCFTVAKSGIAFPSVLELVNLSEYGLQLLEWLMARGRNLGDVAI